MINIIDSELYLRSLGLGKMEDGAQELILSEIVGCLNDCKTIWLPYGGLALSNVLNHLGYITICRPYLHDDEVIDALYFGTPTIVNDTLLFPGQFNGGWTKEIERTVAKLLCNRAIRHGCHCIVSGLGSGDITTNERMQDIRASSGLIPHVVAVKHFIGFDDTVIEAR